MLESNRAHFRSINIHFLEFVDEIVPLSMRQLAVQRHDLNLIERPLDRVFGSRTNVIDVQTKFFAISFQAVDCGLRGTDRILEMYRHHSSLEWTSGQGVAIWAVIAIG